MQEFFGWHNDAHAQSASPEFTPADVFHGRVEAVRVVRQAALDAAYAAHPERFPNGPPIVRLPPSEVHINPLTAEAVVVSKNAPTSGDRVESSGPGRALGNDAITSPSVAPRKPDGGAEPRGSIAPKEDPGHRRAERHHAVTRSGLPPSEVQINPLTAEAVVVSKNAPTSGDRVESNGPGRALGNDRQRPHHEPERCPAKA